MFIFDRIDILDNTQDGDICMVTEHNDDKGSLESSVAWYLRGFVKDDTGWKQMQDILKAMRVVDRKYFVEDEDVAYIDTAMPIGSGQTISQPSTVARMIYSAGVQKGQHVLEIGTGSGWNAALIGYLVYPGKILSLDIYPELSEKAKDNIDLLKKELPDGEAERLSKIDIKHDDFFRFTADTDEMYDAILFTAGIKPEQQQEIEKIAKNLLSESGVVVCPQTRGPMLLMKKVDEKIFMTKTKEEYVFVPLLNRS